MIRMLFDCGNSRCKWAVADGTRILSRGVITGKGAEFTRHLRLAADDVPQPMEAAVVSVAAPDRVAAIETFCRQQWGLPLRQVVTPSQGGGFALPTRSPTRSVPTVGRPWRVPPPAASCPPSWWTAVPRSRSTSSMPAGDHEGGLDRPRAFHHAAFPLPGHPRPATGRRRPDAAARRQHPGCRPRRHPAGLAAMIDGLYREVAASRDSDLQPLVTGGDADTLVAYMATPFTVMPDLVLQGLAAFLEKG
ncbi:MAG: type III pantothenate kinase [Arhodomonas sp.]|nr:type III pantothenate kinase [Arhodomonas sp.]